MSALLSIVGAVASLPRLEGVVIGAVLAVVSPKVYSFVQAKVTAVKAEANTVAASVSSEASNVVSQITTKL